MFFKQGFYKTNFDGTIFQQLNISGIGFVVRDWNGKFVAGLSKKIAGVLDPDVVEAYAIKAVVNLLQQPNLHHAVMEADSQTVINLMHDFESLLDHSRIGVLIGDVVTTWNSYPNWEFTWIPRIRDMATHCLATQASNLSDCCL
ncbi:hypothetical protein ACH5RR_029545 [Cinchona calisaya]|uniref:RNase H type-1 domain-containing protein n=1 Tax=Cinchona calisaya TaxID=153742 RepID=A0ABD2YVA2_9GENT